jgi:phage antirepressor YoqD-like protein
VPQQKSNALILITKQCKMVAISQPQVWLTQRKIKNKDGKSKWKMKKE